MNVGIIILNYLAYQDTINFIQTIKQQNQKNVFLKIIIVDNASTNESVKVLSELYATDEQIELVQTNKNLGFANGNNLGYITLLQYMDPDYVIIANDDILLKQEGLFDWIIQKDAEYQYSVLGPSVYSLRQNLHQNPIENYSTDLKKWHVQIKNSERSLRKIFVKNWIKKILGLDTKIVSLPKWKEQDYQTMTTSLTLHGSFFVFAKRYFNVYTLPFDEQTFLYVEEFILKLRCDAANLVMLYCPDYEVDHVQATANVMLNKSNLDTYYFKSKHVLHSLKRYVCLLEQYQKYGTLKEETIKNNIKH